jgi:hypothetical protein
MLRKVLPPEPAAWPVCYLVFHPLPLAEAASASRCAQPYLLLLFNTGSCKTTTPCHARQCATPRVVSASAYHASHVVFGCFVARRVQVQIQHKALCFKKYSFLLFRPENGGGAGGGDNGQSVSPPQYPAGGGKGGGGDQAVRDMRPGRLLKFGKLRLLLLRFGNHEGEDHRRANRVA